MKNTMVNKINRSNNRVAILFLAPAILLILCITLVPIIYSFYTSVHTSIYAEIGEYVGFKHFVDILSSSEGWMRILNSIVYVFLSLLIVIPLGVGVGTLLNRKIRYRGLIRTMIIIPWVLSQTVTALLLKWLLNANYGPIVYLIYSITGVKADFFNEELIAKFTVVFANVWNTFPIVLILTLAALQTIPKELYEAARIDGAKRWAIFRKITIPIIKPTIVTAIIIQSMEYFNMVTLIYVMTAGGPFGATETLSVKAFKEGFDYWHMDVGSAYSVMIFAMNVIFTLLYIRMLRLNKEK